MMILALTIPVTLTMVILFIVLFVMASKNEQFEDLETPKHAPLSDEENEISDSACKNAFKEQP